MGTFGHYAETASGWPRIDFEDAYKNKCTLGLSSVVLDYEMAAERPGTSAVWLGLSGDVKAKVLARDAASVGIHAETDVGWVDYPIPEKVLIPTCMHLNREQAAGLRDRLTEWLETGQLASSD